MPNKAFAEDDPANSHTHVLFFSDGSSMQPRMAERTPAEPRERARKVARGGSRQQLEDDVVPFWHRAKL